MSFTFLILSSVFLSSTTMFFHLFDGMCERMSAVIFWSFPKRTAWVFLSIRRLAEVFPISKCLIFSSAFPFRILILSSWSFKILESCSFSMALLRSSFSTPLREKILTLMTVPSIPGGTFREVSCTSRAFSPKMARRSFSSGESWVSPLGVIFPTKISFGLISAPMRITPLSSKSFKASSPRPGISRVISSFPNLVSRANTSNSSMWIEV